MAKFTVKAFEEKHLWNMSVEAEVLSHLRLVGFETFKQHLKVMADPNNFACTVLRNGEIAFVLGVMRYEDSKRGEAWAILDKDVVAKDSIRVTRMIRKGLGTLMREEGYEAIEATVPAFDSRGQKFITTVGFKFKEQMPNFLGSSTYFRYERMV